MQLIERLTVNGSILPISGYSINAPIDGLGQSLTIALAKPDITSIPLDADITFEYGAIDAGQESVIALIEGGRLNGRTYTIKWVQDDRGGYPGDLIEFTALSPLADRYSISPPAPVIMYDPETVDGTNLIPPTSQQLRRIVGGVTTYVTPVLESTVDLNLIRVLDRAYVEGCGFDRVITNLPNPPIDRVDFSIESGYHAAAKKFIEQYSLNPIAFEYGNVLYILDPERGLPSGLTAKLLPLDCIVEATQTINPEPLSNAVILQYESNPDGIIYNGEYPSEIIINDPVQENGSGHTYTRQEGYRRLTEYRDLITDDLRRTEEHEIVTRIYGYHDLITINVTPAVPATPGHPATPEVVTRTQSEGEIVLLSRETIENRYVGNTKAGHTYTHEAVFSNPETRGLPEFGEVLREENTTTWTVDLSHPGEYILLRSLTEVTGLVLVETLKDGLIVKTPILDADQGGLIKSDLSQTIATVPIETYIEELKQTGVNQSNVETRIIDHLGGRPRNGGRQGRPGANSTYLPNFAVPGNRAGTIRELIEDEDSVALYGLRRPSSLDVGRLDPVEGRALARRKLRYNITPPKRLSVLLPGIDFSIRRGSVITPPLRSGYDGNHIVIGHNVTASGIGTPNAARRMRLDCREVTLGA